MWCLVTYILRISGKVAGLVEEGGSVFQSIKQVARERKRVQEATKRRLCLGEMNLNLLLLARGRQGIE